MGLLRAVVLGSCVGVCCFFSCGTPVSSDDGGSGGGSTATGGSGGGAMTGGGAGGGAATGGGAAGGGAAGGGGAVGGGAGDDAGVDAGFDAGVVDAGPPPDVSLPAQPCVDSASAVTAAAGTPSQALGERLACHFERSLTANEVAMKTPSAPAAASPVDLFLISYRTTRRGQVPGAGTARVYLPKQPAAGPLPAVVVVHGSVGVADSCAPSAETEGLFSMAMPWVSRGYAVIAPDLAGLGNATVQGYVDNHDTAMSTLDAVRALRSFVRPRAIDGRAILVGFSQGGGAVLAAQSLEGAYGSGGRIASVVAVAPQFFTRLNSFGFVNMLRMPDALTVAQGYTKPVVAALRTYAWYENTLGAGHGVEAFPADGGAGTVAALESRCLIDLGAWLPSNRTHVRDLMDDTLRTTFLACVDGPFSSGCVPPGKTLYDGLSGDTLHGDPTGAPVLYLQGSLDTVMPIGEEAACNVPAMRNAGVPLTFCTDGLALHSNIYDRNVELVRTWAEATALGLPAPSCTVGTPPACPP
ncbi:MAG: alpha/beta fold hydrolase [Myxococcaceae bacterium]